MKNNKYVLILIIVCASLVLMSACGSNNKTINNSVDDNCIVLNMPNGAEEKTSINGVDYKFKAVYYDFLNHNECKSLRIDITVTNRNVDAIKLDINNSYAVREENGAKYACGNTYFGYGDIECDKSASFYISASGLPTDIFANKYHLIFEINEQHFRINLYNDIPYLLTYDLDQSPIEIALDNANLLLKQESDRSYLCISCVVTNTTDSLLIAQVSNCMIIDNEGNQFEGRNPSVDIQSNQSAKILVFNVNLNAGEYKVDFLLLNKHFIINVVI